MRNKAENKFSLKYLTAPASRGRFVWATATLVAGFFLFGIIGCSTLNSPDKPFPNSYTVSSGAADITFTDIPADCTIEIYSLGLDLVQRIAVVNGDGQAAWDLKNKSGETVRSGIYNYVIITPQERKTGKIVITK